MLMELLHSCCSSRIMNVLDVGLFCLNDSVCCQASVDVGAGGNLVWMREEITLGSRAQLRVKAQECSLLASGRNDQVAIIGSKGEICLAEVHRPMSFYFLWLFSLQGRGSFFLSQFLKDVPQASYLKAGIIHMAKFTDLLNVYKLFLLFSTHY